MNMNFFLISKERAKQGDGKYISMDRSGAWKREDPFPIPSLLPPVGQPRTMSLSELGFSQLGREIIKSISPGFMKRS